MIRERGGDRERVNFHEGQGVSYMVVGEGDVRYDSPEVSDGRRGDCVERGDRPIFLW